MCYSRGDVAVCFSREVERKRAMCYRRPRARLPLDGFWRPRDGEIAPATVSWDDDIEGEVASMKLKAKS